MRVHGVWCIEGLGPESDNLGSGSGFGRGQVSTSGAEELDRLISIGWIKVTDLDLQVKAEAGSANKSYLSMPRPWVHSHSPLDYSPQKHPT